MKHKQLLTDYFAKFTSNYFSSNIFFWNVYYLVYATRH